MQSTQSVLEVVTSNTDLKDYIVEEMSALPTQQLHYLLGWLFLYITSELLT